MSCILGTPSGYPHTIVTFTVLNVLHSRHSFRLSTYNSYISSLECLALSALLQAVNIQKLHLQSWMSCTLGTPSGCQHTIVNIYSLECLALLALFQPVRHTIVTLRSLLTSWMFCVLGTLSSCQTCNNYGMRFVNILNVLHSRHSFTLSDIKQLCYEVC